MTRTQGVDPGQGRAAAARPAPPSAGAAAAGRRDRPSRGRAAAATTSSTAGSGWSSPDEPPAPRARPAARRCPQGGLRVVALGGLGEVGRNMAVLEYDGRLLVIDCGVLFPEDHQPGVDLILPGLRVHPGPARRHRGRRPHPRPRGPHRRRARTCCASAATSRWSARG